MGTINFVKKTIGELINNFGNYPMNTFHAVGDLNNDGFLDIVVSGRKGRMVWLENKGKKTPWSEHLIYNNVEHMECGGSLADLTHNGYLDIINGANGTNEIWWWENPGAKGGIWKKSTILKTKNYQFHDTIIGDVTNDGRKSLVFTNQGKEGTTIYCIPLPKDPHVCPWPDVMVVARGMREELVGPKGNIVKMQSEEGLAIGDIDGDDKNEVVCGAHWFKFKGKTWEKHRFAQGYITTKIAVGDIDDDGGNEIILSEGDPCIYGKTQGGKMSWFRPKADITDLWEEYVLEDCLLDAHTLALGDITGNGALDLVVGEIGVANEQREYKDRAPRIMVFENNGKAKFTRHIIDVGTGIHDGVLVDTLKRGKLDVVGKPLHGPERWNVHVYFNECR